MLYLPKLFVISYLGGIITMKANVAEIAMTYLTASPNARVLLSDVKSFKADNRVTFFNQIKNLMLYIRHDRVGGLGNIERSQRELNHLYVIRTIQERTGKDSDVIFLCGTTISNSLTELYLLFKYLSPNELEHQDIRCLLCFNLSLASTIGLLSFWWLSSYCFRLQDKPIKRLYGYGI